MSNEFHGELVETLPEMTVGNCKYSCYTNKSKSAKGTESYRLYCRRVDKKCKPYETIKKAQTIKVETKPSGAYSDYLEVGAFTKDEFGDTVWEYNEYRYPHKDPRLKVKRDFVGTGKSQTINWTIIIPSDYPDYLQVIPGERRPAYMSSQANQILYP